MGHEILSPPETLVTVPPFQTGVTLFCNPNETNSQDAHDSAWFTRAAHLSYSSDHFFEVQYECNFNQNYWQSLALILKQLPNPHGVHQPIRHRDVISTDSHIAASSLKDTQTAMDFAHQSRADYLVLHLTQQNHWPQLMAAPDREQARDKMLTSAFQVFDLLAGYHRHQGYSFPLLIENLEYPKHPSRPDELISTYHQVAYLSQVHQIPWGIAIDVAHIWNNHVHLIEPVQPPQTFTTTFSHLLDKINSHFPGKIHLFHFGGAYLHHSSNTYQTHGVPGVAPNSNFSPTSSLYLDGAPPDFPGIWMNITDALQVIKYFSVHTQQNIRLLLEVHQNDTDLNLLSADQIETLYQSLPIS